ncbi:MAG: M23 family metallopeptidase [Treponemataceae bacterium]|nr:M23 family metallopeptidase [Treponemataceae bacterium]
MKRTAAPLLFLAAAQLAAFDWPQVQPVQLDSFYSYFGQLRGGTISSSLIFSEPSEVKAADGGYLTVIIREHNDETDFFPSALGNAVVIAHKDSLLTVYANIDAASLDEINVDRQDVEAGAPLGSTGDSAWQHGNSALEFQVIDTKNNTAINPRLLAPRIGRELPLSISGIVMQGRNGRFYEASRQNALPAGTYRVYARRQPTAVPYKTRISINGTLVDELLYDLLRQDGNQLCVSGRKNYPKDAVYPDGRLHLIGEANLAAGHNALQLTLIDILGKETSALYNLSIY